MGFPERLVARVTPDIVPRVRWIRVVMVYQSFDARELDVAFTAMGGAVFQVVIVCVMLGVVRTV